VAGSDAPLRRALGSTWLDGEVDVCPVVEEYGRRSLSVSCKLTKRVIFVMSSMNDCGVLSNLIVWTNPAGITLEVIVPGNDDMKTS
jgi:hypothetical protein